MNSFSKEQLNDIFEWDVENWSCVLNLWEQYTGNLQNKTALALGERNGGLSLYLALKGAKVHATDVNGVTEHAIKKFKHYNVEDKIIYNKVDFSNINYEEGMFDIVVFKSVLGHFSEKQTQQKAINEAHRVLKKNGLLIFAENLKGSGMHNALRKNFVQWSSRWRYINLKNDLDLFNDFTMLDYRCYGFLGLLGRTEAQKRMLGKLDRNVFRHLPENYKYIMSGVCRK